MKNNTDSFSICQTITKHTVQDDTTDYNTKDITVQYYKLPYDIPYYMIQHATTHQRVLCKNIHKQKYPVPYNTTTQYIVLYKTKHYNTKDTL